ncbi:MAG: gliding motility protein GldN [Haliscomenobacter sp.]|nr:gliding motility protein GldN [Haliscomenobacter sp.]
MKIAVKGIAFFFALVCFASLSNAQTLPGNIITESGMQMRPAPLDDIVENTTAMKRRIIPYEVPREADIFWKKRVWRVIDVREKMNLPFAYPPRPLLQIIIDAANKGVEDPENPLPPLRVFTDEDFKQEMDTAALSSILFQSDTVTVTDPETYLPRQEIIRNDINFEDIQRYRIKEIWFFDKESSTMQVRILGIAPVKPVKADNSDIIIGERPMFWIYYPEAREYFARERVFNAGNDASPMSWEDIMEMRFFSSYIYKSSNVKDSRLQDQFPDSRRDLLMEAEKIKQEIFNFEQDLWTY